MGCISVWKRSLLARDLIKLQILYNCVIKFLIGHFHVPSAANYLTDAITLALFLLMLSESNAKIKKNPQMLFFLGFFAVTIVSYAINMYSPMLYIWGARNIFRFYIFFFACVHYMDCDACLEIFGILKKIFWINFVLICIQKWVLHYIGDGCSGLYSLGNRSGGNGSINILMCLVVAYVMSEYMTKKISLQNLLMYIVATVAIAAFIELKFYFIELAILFAIFAFAQHLSIKTFVIVIGAFGVLMVGTNILEKMYPSFAGIFTVDAVVQNSLIYGTQDSIGRLSGMGTVLQNYLLTIPQKLFGIGLGNADYSLNISILTSEFYRQHGANGYTFFSSAWMLLELGIVGMFFYLAPIFYALFLSWKFRTDRTQTAYLTLFISAITILQFFYNQMLRVETSGYLMQFVLALVYIYKNERIFRQI